MKMSTLEKAFANSSTHSVRVSDHAQALLQLIDFEPGQRYLDVGCGNGAAPINIAKIYHLDVTRVDVDPEQIQEAKRSSADVDNAHFAIVDGTDLRFGDGTFHIVATNKDMHHVPYWKTAWVEMIRVLTRGGYLLFNDLVYPKWLAAIGRAFGENWAGFPTRVAIEDLIDGHGLHQIHRSISPMHYEVVLQK